MKSEANSVEQYIASLSEDRRDAVEKVREVILHNLDDAYEEGMQYGMIGYFVPLKMYSAGYNGNPNQPLMIAALASQKNYLSFYLAGTYCGCGDGTAETPDMAWFRQAWAKTGKKLSMGKACVRFKTAEELALDVIGEAIRRLPALDYIAQYKKVSAGKLVVSGKKKVSVR